MVSAAIGYGRRAAGKVGTGAGVDVYPPEVEQGRLIFSGQDGSSKTDGFILWPLPSGTPPQNRPIINDITLGEFIKNPKRLTTRIQ